MLETMFFSDVALSVALIQTDFEQLEDGGASAGLPYPADRVVYFGLANSLKQIRAASNPGVDPILISIVSAVALRQNSTTYADGDILQPDPPNGYKYVVEGNGDSGASPPFSVPTTIGVAVTDGAITLRCLDEIHEASEIRLATSQAGLDSATPGADLNLGTSIAGGTPIPIWMRVAQGAHPAGNSVFTDLKLQTVELVEPPI